MNNINDFLNEWNWIRGLTIKFIESIPEDKLTFYPSKNFGSLGTQLRHIVTVQECYLNGFEKGRIDFSKKRKDKTIESSKKKLLEYAKLQDERLKKIVSQFSKKDLQKIIKWKVWEPLPNPSISQCFVYMIEHESYHQGILQLCADLAGFKTIRFF